MPQPVLDCRPMRPLETLRTELGWTQAELGKALGRGQPFISDIERGQERMGALTLTALLDNSSLVWAMEKREISTEDLLRNGEAPG